jgi:isocitrate/isopropylmalate dehydrogenase
MNEGAASHRPMTFQGDAIGPEITDEAVKVVSCFEMGNLMSDRVRVS